ncbi:hypothetical protein P9112_005665 [Eukaryota sp. TZLM1-RC]
MFDTKIRRTMVWSTILKVQSLKICCVGVPPSSPEVSVNINIQRSIVSRAKPGKRTWIAPVEEEIQLIASEDPLYTFTRSSEPSNSIPLRIIWRGSQRTVRLSTSSVGK